MTNGNPLNKVEGLTSRLTKDNLLNKVGDLTSGLTNDNMDARRNRNNGRGQNRESMQSERTSSTQRFDITTERVQEVEDTLERQEAGNVGGRDRSNRNSRNRGGGFSNARSQLGRGATSMQTSLNERDSVDRMNERDRIKGNTLGRQQADIVGGRDRNNRNSRNRGGGSSNARSKFGRGTTSMQTSVNKRDNQQADRTTESKRVETSQSERTLNQRAAKEEKNTN